MRGLARIRFKGVSLAEANRLAGSLEQLLREQAPEAQPTRIRDDPSTMDFGVVVELVLSAATHAAVTVALEVWRQRHSFPSIEMETSRGSSVIAGPSGSVRDTLEEPKS